MQNRQANIQCNLYISFHMYTLIIYNPYIYTFNPYIYNFFHTLVCQENESAILKSAHVHGNVL